MTKKGHPNLLEWKENEVVKVTGDKYQGNGHK